MLQKSPHQRLVTPVFWVKDTSNIQVGYFGPSSLLGLVAGIVKGFLSLLFGSGNGSDSHPPGISESDIPGNSEPPPVPIETEEVDWSDVNVVALASSSVPKIARLLAGPAQRALNDLSKGKATLHIVAERTHPIRFKTIQDMTSVEANPIYFFILIDKQDSGLVKGIITKKIETKVLNKLDDVKAPFELIFRRVNRTLYDQIILALETSEPEPKKFEREKSTSILRDLGLLKLAQDKSDSKALKLLSLLKLGQDKILNPTFNYDLSERGFPFKKIILVFLLGFGIFEFVKKRKDGQ